MFLLKFIKSPKARYILGLAFLLGVVLLWVGSSFLTSYLFQDQSFNRPFFLTYFNTGCFSLYLVIVYSTRLIKFFAGKKSTQVEDASR
jgi:solute carrier family 35 protein F5